MKVNYTKSKLIILLFFSLSNYYLAQEKQIFPYFNGAKWGYVAEDYTEVQKPQFASMVYLTQAFNIVIADNKFGALNKQGELILKPEYDLVEEYSSSYSIAKRKDSIFLYNLKQSKINYTIKAKDYLNANDNSLYDSYFIYNNNNLSSILNLQSQKIISSNTYTTIKPIRNYLREKNYDSYVPYYYYNDYSKGQSLENKKDKLFSNYIIVGTKNKLGILDLKTGQLKTQCIYIDFKLDFFGNELILIATINEKTSHQYNENLIKQKNKNLGKILADEATEGSQDMVVAEGDGDYPISPNEISNKETNSYFIQKQNETSFVIQQIKIENKSLEILKTKLITNVKRVEFFPYNNKTSSLFLITNTKYKSGIINFDGDTILNVEYDIIERLYTAQKYNCYRIGKNNRYGLINGAAKIVIQPECNVVMDAEGSDDNKFCLFKKNDAFGIFKFDSSKIIDPIFKTTSYTPYSSKYKMVELLNGKKGVLEVTEEKLLIPEYINVPLNEIK